MMISRRPYWCQLTTGWVALSLLGCMFLGAGCDSGGGGGDSSDDDEPVAASEITIGETGDSQFEFAAVRQNGEALLVDADQRVAVYYTADGRALRAEGDANGRPTRVITDDGVILIFSNYTDDTVDVAVITAQGDVTIEREVSLSQYANSFSRRLLASRLDEALYRSANNLPKDADVSKDINDVFTAIQWGSLVVGVSLCVGGLILAPAGGIGAPLLVGCAGTLVSGIALAVDSSELGVGGAALGTASCVASPVSASAGAGCLNTLVGTTAQLGDELSDELSDSQDDIDLAQGTLAGGGGDVQVTLTWNNASDLDLWVTEPSGEQIGHPNRNSGTGGELDFDDTDGYGPENIYWAQGTAPRGSYTVEVHHYSGSSTANYEVLVQYGNQSRRFTGSLAPFDRTTVSTFTL